MLMPELIYIHYMSGPGLSGKMAIRSYSWQGKSKDFQGYKWKQIPKLHASVVHKCYRFSLSG